MICYNLPNGKSIFLSIDEYLTLTDEEIQFLVAYDYGEDINNSHYGSVLSKLSKEDLEEENETYELDNTSIDYKIGDLDMPVDMN